MLDQINQYLKDRQNKLIGISELAEHVGQREGKVFVALLELQKLQTATIYRIHICSKGHQLSQDLNCCPVCDRAIPEEEIHALIFAKSLS